MSDILIKDMEMPTNKFGRVLLIYPNGEVVVGGETKYKAISTTDARPVVRGKWIFDDFDDDRFPYQCSECGAWARTNHNYCPNCGADMRAEDLII